MRPLTSAFFCLGGESPLFSFLAILLSVTSKSYHASASIEPMMLPWSMLSDLHQIPVPGGFTGLQGARGDPYPLPSSNAWPFEGVSWCWYSQYSWRLSEFLCIFHCQYSHLIHQIRRGLHDPGRREWSRHFTGSARPQGCAYICSRWGNEFAGEFPAA